jgi:hypothetical protein
MSEIPLNPARSVSRARLSLSARLTPRLIIGQQMILPGTMDVDSGRRTESVTVEEAVHIAAGAITRVEGHKAASGGVSQSIGITQTVTGHKVEHEVPAPPRRTTQWVRKPRRHVSIEWNEWEFGTIQVGALVGTAVNVATGDHLGYVPCMAGGALVFYAWGWWRWWDENRQR